VADELLEPIEQVIEAVQQELRKREGTQDRAAGVELYIAQWWALHALRESRGNAFTKETQIRLAGGRPLAVCCGGGKGRLVKTFLGESLISGWGCFSVFEDATRLSGKMWPRWCPGCRNNRRRNPFREQQNAVRRRAYEIARLRAGTLR
jgi:hypothetical protein